MGPLDHNRKSGPPCVHHSAARGAWLCTGCGGRFCLQCVRPMQSFYNPLLGGYQDRTGICPDCKGRCVDPEFEEEKRRLQERAEAEARRCETQRQAWFAVLTLQFVAGALYRVREVTPALDLQYMLFVFGLVRYGPWRSLAFETKTFFGRVLPFALMANVGAYIIAGLSGSDTGHFLFMTPVKYAGISLLLFAAVHTLERSADLFGHIYTGSREPTGWTGRDRILAYLSLALVLYALFYFLAIGWAGLAEMLGW